VANSCPGSPKNILNISKNTFSSSLNKTISLQQLKQAAEYPDILNNSNKFY
jgi:hypothetical protein